MYLEIEGICKRYGDEFVLREVALSLDKGKSLAIVAPSGAGKSTLLSISGLLLAPDSGSVRLGGLDVSTLTDEERSMLRGQEIGFLFQHTQLVGTLRAWENVAVAGDFAGPRRGLGGGAKRGAAKFGEREESGRCPGGRRPAADAAEAGYSNAEAAKERAVALLESFGLAERVHHFPHQLSVGQKRRIATARALFSNPELIIADEPTNDLDEDNARLVVDALFARVESGESALLLATHDKEVAVRADACMHLA